MRRSCQLQRGAGCQPAGTAADWQPALHSNSALLLRRPIIALAAVVGLLISAPGTRQAFAATPPSKTLSAEQKQRLEKADKLSAEVERLCDTGKFREAIAPAQEVLRIHREVLGPENQKTVESLSGLASILTSAGELAQALPLRQQTAELYRKVWGPNHLETATALDNLAVLYANLGDYAKALPLSQEGWEIRRKALGSEHLETALSLDTLAGLYERMGQYSKALPLQQQALEIRRKALGPEHRLTAINTGDLAHLYFLMGNYAKALPLYQQALALDRRVMGPEDRMTVRSLHELGNLYRVMGEYAKAQPLLEQAVEIDRRTLGPDHHETALCLNELASLCVSLADFARAAALFQESLDSVRKEYGIEHPDTAAGLTNLAGLYAVMGEYSKALPLFQRAAEIDEKILGPEHPHTAVCLSNLAFLYSRMGDYATAVPLQQRALDIHRKTQGPEHPGTLRDLNGLAQFYRAQGELAKALPLCQQALEGFRRVCGPEHPDSVLCLGNLALVYEGLGEYGKALPLYTQALAINRKRLGPEHPDTATSLRVLASLHLSMGEAPKALPLLQQALEIDRKAIGPRDADTASVLAVLAQCYCALGRYGEAAEPARQAAEIENQALEDVAPSLPDAQAMNVIETRRIWLDGLVSAAIRTGADLDRVYGLIWQRRGLLLSIGQLRRQLGRAAEASPEVARKFAEYRAVRAELARLMMMPASAAPGRAQQSLERAKLCGQRKERLETELGRLMPAVARQLAASRRAPVDLRAKLPADAAFVDFVAYYQIGPGATKHGGARPTSAPLARAAGEGQRGTRTVPTPRCYAAFLILPGAPTACVELGRADVINRAIESWSQALAEEQPSPSAATLRKLIWEPIERQLPRETKTVYLCPEGSLTRLSWAALPGRSEATGTGRGPAAMGPGAGPTSTGRVLLEDYALALVPSGQFLLEQQTAPPPPPSDRGTLLAVGDVTYDARPAPAGPAPTMLAAARLRSAVIGDRQLRWPALPATAAELSDVIGACRQRDFNLVRLSQAEAATDRVIAELPKARWAHLATHGFFADKKFRSAFQLPDAAGPQTGLGQGQRSTVAGRNPLVLSGLVLAGANLPRHKDELGVPQGDGGILTAETVATLPLDNLELAVLSACETGFGDLAGGEGAFGLQRAFHIAGARNVVASLWKVDDQATATLMQLFYRNLWARRLPPLESLRQAQLTIYHHPELIKMSSASRGLAFDRLETLPDAGRRAPDPATTPARQWAAFVLSGIGR